MFSLGEQQLLRSRLRGKGQLTIPVEIHNILGAQEGDELVSINNEDGSVTIERELEQVWFWWEHWQRFENEVQ